MTSSEYADWSRQHAALFQLHGEGDVAMFGAWWPLLAKESANECEKASLWIAQNKGGVFRTQHLQLIMEFLRGRKIELLRQQNQIDANADEKNRCPKCGGVGLVVVPHPKSITDLEWMPPYYTLGVKCDCPRGMAKQNQCMTLRSYEAINHRWPEMLCERENEIKDRLNARDAAAKADHRHGQIAVQAALAKMRGNQSPSHS